MLLNVLIVLFDAHGVIMYFWMIHDTALETPRDRSAQGVASTDRAGACAHVRPWTEALEGSSGCRHMKTPCGARRGPRERFTSSV